MSHKLKFPVLRKFLIFAFGRVAYEYLVMKVKHGYWPHLRHPRTFSEKVCHRKLFKPYPHSHILADKLQVRKFVAERVGEQVLNKLHFAGTDPERIPFPELPQKFVVKVNNGSGGNLLVRDKNQTTQDGIRSWCRDALKQKFGSLSNELWYEQIEPKILIEEFLDDKEHDVPRDFKFFCFGGKPVVVQVNFDRFINHTRSFYDMNWKLQNFRLRDASGPAMDKPEGFEKMIAVAEKLSEGSDFLRVDLYLIGGDVRFGEITLAPGAGWEPFFPSSADFELGRYWKADEDDGGRSVNQCPQRIVAP